MNLKNKCQSINIYSKIYYFVHSSFFIKSIFLTSFLSLTYMLIFIMPEINSQTVSTIHNDINIFIILITFFSLSFLIAVISVLAGIGGGILFTPLMMAFSNIDSTLIRGTGLIVAMFSGLISTGPFMRSGLANFRLTLLLASTFGVGAIFGSNISIALSSEFGFFGEALIRFLLSLLLFGLSIYFIIGVKKIEWPESRESCLLTKLLSLRLPYHEKTINKVVSYHINNTLLGISSILVVGFISGFFGLGGGWAIVPIQNLIMSVPLKVACANSGVLIGMGDSIAIWPYIREGAIIPLFVTPWMVGQVFGGIIGAKYLSDIKAKNIRYILIGIMLFTSFSLAMKSFILFKIIGNFHWTIYLLVFLSIFVSVFLLYKKSERKVETVTSSHIFEEDLRPLIHKSQLVYGNIVYYLTGLSAIFSLIFLILAFLSQKMSFFEQKSIIYKIFIGVKLNEIWNNFSLFNEGFSILFKLDLWTIALTVLGCLSPALALVFSVFHLIKEKSFVFSLLSLWIIFLIALSATGILTFH